MKEVLDYFIPFMRYKYDDGKGNHNINFIFSPSTNQPVAGNTA
jgi:hypothetical protein